MFIHEFGGMDLEEMFNKTKKLSDVAEIWAIAKKIDYEMFIAIPTSKAFELNQIFHKYRAIFTFKEEKILYPHLSTEAFPNFHHLIHPCEINGIEENGANELEESCEIEGDDDERYSMASLLRKFTSIAQQFGLVVYKIEVKRRKV